METSSGVKVYVSDTSSNWKQLKGYSGGVTLGMSVGTEQSFGDDDGIARFIKGSATGSESSIMFREISGDDGQEKIKELAGVSGDGVGFLRVDLPQGVSLAAEGVFHGVTRMPYDPDQYQGYTVGFTQNEPEFEI